MPFDAAILNPPVLDDLIRQAAHLLGQPGLGEWIRYKLDQATEHVLIDEKQGEVIGFWRQVSPATRPARKAAA